MKKICKKCNIEKEILDFPKHKSYKDGHSTWCKICHNSVLKTDEHRIKSRQRKAELRKCPVYKAFEKLTYQLRKKSRWRETSYISIKTGAKKRGIEFSIELNDIPELTELCPILKVPMVINTKYAPSIDRIENDKGYIPGNIQIISRFANAMKSSATKDELLMFSNFWIEYFSK